MLCSGKQNSSLAFGALQPQVPKANRPPVENLFDSGSAEMKKVGLEWMKTLASTLKKSSFLELRIEGHTDNSPIKSTKFPSNWELSSARASNVVKYFIGTGFESQKLAAVGYADSRPIASNTTADGKAKNRRIEFTIVTTDSKTEGTGAD